MLKYENVIKVSYHDVYRTICKIYAYNRTICTIYLGNLGFWGFGSSHLCHPRLDGIKVETNNDKTPYYDGNYTLLGYDIIMR